VTRADTVGIVGAGTFGTALGSVLARAGRRVVLWSRDEGVVRSIQTSRQNPRTPAVPLPEPLEATADPRHLASAARFLVLAVASTDVRDRSRELGDVIDGSHIVVHAVGALAMPSNERVSEVMAHGLPTLKLGVLAGPALPADLAPELSSDAPSDRAARPSSDGVTLTSSASMVVASVFDEVVAEGRRLLNAPPSLRVYGSKDLIGVELASALSGAYTVALGLSDGMGIGIGTRAVLITRIVAEATRLGIAAGAQIKTFAGLAGLGNLLVRASGASPADAGRSADYRLGRRLAEGGVPAGAAITEGARAAIAGAELARTLRVRMPVLTGIAAVLAGKVDPRDAAKLVMDSVALEE